MDQILLLFLEHYIQERIKLCCLNLLHLLTIGGWIVLSSKLNSWFSVVLGLKCKVSLMGPQSSAAPFARPFPPVMHDGAAWCWRVGRLTTTVGFGQHYIAFGMSHILNVADTCCSVAKSFLTLCEPMSCSMPGFPVLHYLPEFAQTMSFESVMPSSHPILCHPCLLLPSVLPSIRVFSTESALHIRWPKYWSFSFSISPSSDYSGLLSIRIDWFYLLAVQGTLKSFLQHHSLKTSILQCSAFFMVQLLHPYMTAGKTIALTVWTFVSKVMSLLFNTLSRFVKTLHHDLILT